MTIKLINITNEPIQRHTILSDDNQIVFTLRFYPKQQMWCGKIELDGEFVKGFKLSTGVLHILNSLFPLDFYVTDNSLNGLDPFKRDDFSSGRCSIYMLQEDDLTQIRGGIVNDS